MLSTAWGARGGGGRGRLKELGIGFAVLAYEYVGDEGMGGRADGVGGRLSRDILKSSSSSAGRRLDCLFTVQNSMRRFAEARRCYLFAQGW